MKLSKLLEHLNFTCIQGSTDTDITDLLYDSRKVHEGSVFVCGDLLRQRDDLIVGFREVTARAGCECAGHDNGAQKSVE